MGVSNRPCVNRNGFGSVSRPIRSVGGVGAAIVVATATAMPSSPIGTV